jgi:hypothetical protein
MSATKSKISVIAIGDIVEKGYRKSTGLESGFFSE